VQASVVLRPFFCTRQRKDELHETSQARYVKTYYDFHIPALQHM
jgi:hypothetical protein